MAQDDYYKVLGVSREASADEIRKAYKRLSRENHPDRKKGDKAAAETFKKVQQAWSVLGDPEKREQYDRYGAAFEHARGGPRGQSYTWSTGPGGGGPIDLESLFGGGIDIGDLFGGYRPGGGGPTGGFGGGFGTGGQTRTARPRRGEDVRQTIEIPFRLAAEGGPFSLDLRRNGKVERLNVRIPAGIEDGKTIRLAGEGQPGTRGGSSGDLLLTVTVTPHRYFRRDGRDLFLELPVTPSEAALGAKVEAPTLSEGMLMLTLPPSSSSGRKLRLRGKGVLDPKTQQRGDQFVVIKIVVPPRLTERARQLYEQLAEESADGPRRGLWG